MSLIKTLRGFTPKFGKNCFIAETATVIGNVEMGDNCTIWFNAVLRGDVHYIKMGNDVNVQDGVTIHCTYEKSPVNIGNNVSIAHNAIVHGCTIHDNVLIGMGAIILDDAVIESNSIIAAGAVVSKNSVVKSGSVYGGMPAKLIKQADERLVKGEIERIVNHYNYYASWYDENHDPLLERIDKYNK